MLEIVNKIHASMTHWETQSEFFALKFCIPEKNRNFMKLDLTDR